MLAVDVAERPVERHGRCGRRGQSTYHELATHTLPVGRWIDVSIAIDHTTTPQRVTATFDGETIVAGVPLETDLPSAKATAIAGSDYASAGPAVTLDVDDVRVERTPL